MRYLIVPLMLFLPIRAGIHTIATITGTGATVQISTDSTSRPQWIQIIAPSSNSAAVYFGDSTVTSSRGLPVAPGAGYNTPACPDCVYSLAATYVYVGNGDKVYAAWGN